MIDPLLVYEKWFAREDAERPNVAGECSLLEGCESLDRRRLFEMADRGRDVLPDEL